MRHDGSVIGARREEADAEAGARRLGPSLLARLPEAVRRPAYDRSALSAGIAHIGVGAFHRCHQAEYTDDLLQQRFDRWGIVGVNIRPPTLTDTIGRQGGLYTRLLRSGSAVDARVIGSIVSVVDSQDSPSPALDVLASPEIDLVTLTVTEKGYCHRPSTGELDFDAPDIAHDLANPEAPRSLPGLIVRALEQRRATHGQPLTVMSCDNIPSNGAILSRVVGALAERRDNRLAEWIAANAAFPSTMVDRIVPATSQADHDTVEQSLGFRDEAVVAGEPFRQWVIETRFAGRFPRWDLVGASFVEDVAPFELLKMRVLNAAQSTLAPLGVLARLDYTCDDMADPVLSGFVRRMLLEESVPTLPPVPGIAPERYVEQSLDRLRNTAIRHRNHQIATDGSQKIVQRLLNPIRERLARGEGAALLAVPVAAWIAYVAFSSERLGRRWLVADPFADQIAAIATRIGGDAPALAAAILSIDAIFDGELAASIPFRTAVAEGLRAFLSDDPRAYVRGFL